MKRWKTLSGRRAIAVVMVAASLAFGSMTAVAANPSGWAYGYASSCYYSGLSEFTPDYGWWGFATTNPDTPSYCTGQKHVHAYFWGSDYAWHYAERTEYTGGALTASYTWWTNDVYGYHNYPGAGSALTTHAY